jgi:hypothetical protein
LSFFVFFSLSFLSGLWITSPVENLFVPFSVHFLIFLFPWEQERLGLRIKDQNGRKRSENISTIFYIYI